MRVLVVDPAGGVTTGGGQKYAAAVAMEFDKRGFEVYMPAIDGRSATMHLTEESGVIKDYPPIESEIDLMVYTEPLNAYVLLINLDNRKIKRSVLLAYYHSKSLSKDAVSRFDDVLCIGTAHAQLCAKYWEIPLPHVIAPGAHPIEFKPEKKRDLLITYSRLDKYKAHSVSMRFARTFVRDWDYISMGFLGGDQDERNALEGLQIDIRADLPVKERDEVLQEASIGMFLRGLIKYGSPTVDMEGWGICLVESMSAGVVPIAYADGGHLDIITEDSGILVETDQEVMKALVKLSTDREYREHLMYGAAKRARELDIKIWLPRLVDYLIDGRLTS